MTLSVDLEVNKIIGGEQRKFVLKIPLPWCLKQILYRPRPIIMGTTEKGFEGFVIMKSSLATNHKSTLQLVESINTDDDYPIKTRSILLPIKQFPLYAA